MFWMVDPLFSRGVPMLGQDAPMGHAGRVSPRGWAVRPWRLEPVRSPGEGKLRGLSDSSMAGEAGAMEAGADVRPL